MSSRTARLALLTTLALAVRTIDALGLAGGAEMDDVHPRRKMDDEEMYDGPRGGGEPALNACMIRWWSLATMNSWFSDRDAHEPDCNWQCENSKRLYGRNCERYEWDGPPKPTPTPVKATASWPGGGCRIYGECVVPKPTSTVAPTTTTAPTKPTSAPPADGGGTVFVMGGPRETCPHPSSIITSREVCHEAIKGLVDPEGSGDADLGTLDMSASSRLKNRLAKGCAFKDNNKVEKAVWNDPSADWRGGDNSKVGWAKPVCQASVLDTMCACAADFGLCDGACPVIAAVDEEPKCQALITDHGLCRTNPIMVPGQTYADLCPEACAAPPGYELSKSAWVCEEGRVIDDPFECLEAANKLSLGLASTNPKPFMVEAHHSIKTELAPGCTYRADKQRLYYNEPDAPWEHGENTRLAWATPLCLKATDRRRLRHARELAAKRAQAHEEEVEQAGEEAEEI